MSPSRPIALVTLSFAALLALAPLDAQAPRTLALVGGMLLDGYDVPPVHHAAVVIEGNRIVQVGPKDQVRIPENATVIDTSGRTMLPGLIDLHAHLVILGHGNYGTWFPWIEKHGGDEMLTRVMEISARQLLMAGITSAVDLGAPLAQSLDVRDRVAANKIPGPRLSVSGPWITRRAAVFPASYQREIKSPEEAAQATEALAKAGVDVIKAHSGLTRDDYRAIADAAHRHGLRVHAHVYDAGAVRDALEGGIDVLTHAGSAGTPPYEPDLLRAIVEAGRPVVITAAHRPWIYPDTVAFPERLQDPQLASDFPAEIYEEVQRSLRNFHTLGYFSTTDRQIFFSKASLRQWIEGGAVMGMGTDSGTPMNFHTEALWREIKAHVDTGMSPHDAINAATRVNARILGKARDLGTVEAGKLADVIVVEGNPLFDVTALGHVEVVVKDGVVYKGGPVAPSRESAAR